MNDLNDKEQPLGCAYCGALWWPKDHPVHECIGSLRARLGEAKASESKWKRDAWDTIVAMAKACGLPDVQDPLTAPDDYVLPPEWEGKMSDTMRKIVSERDEASRLSHQYRNERDALRDKLAEAEAHLRLSEATTDRATAALAQAVKERDEARETVSSCSRNEMRLANDVACAREQRDAALAKLGETTLCSNCNGTGITSLGSDEGHDYCEACHVGREMALQSEVDEYADQNSRLSALLTQTADALKGNPPPLVNHDWSDLPKVASALRAKLAQAAKERDEWKANHDNQVAIKQAVLDRPDLGDRARRVLELIQRVSEAEALLMDIKENLYPDGSLASLSPIAERAKAFLKKDKTQ